MSKQKTDKRFDWAIREGVGILTIGSPPENYLEKPEFIPLNQLKELCNDENLRGIVISGYGRHFSAGADLGILYSMSKDENLLRENIEQGKLLLSYIENLDIPVVAAIKGVCFGGGLEVALAAHIRICSQNALFAFPETNHRMIPGMGGTSRSLRLAGFPMVLRMILSGDVVNAEEAREMNLVDKISAEDPLEDAFTLIKKMTSDKPLKVILSVMQALRNARTLSPAESLREETRLFCELASDEAKRRNSV